MQTRFPESKKALKTLTSDFQKAYLQSEESIPS